MLARHGFIGAAAVAAAWVSNAIGGYSGAPVPLIAQQQAQRPPQPAQPAQQPTPKPQPPAAQPAPQRPQQNTPQSTPQQNGESFPPPPEVFGFATVQRIARERAMRPYENRSTRIPQVLAKLSYDQYRDLRFRRNFALWHNQSLFEVQFFHRGFNFDRRVSISEVSEGVARPIEYNPAWFEFGRLARVAAKLPQDLGFAGFRVHYPLQTPNYKDELIVFLGASYFRVLGRNQSYGLSARGLAINTATTAGEEFPWFTDFWLVKPQAEQRSLTIYALLDSESITGAYQFEVRPGRVTQVEVNSELYPRKAIEKLGIAPLTSMFLFGADQSGHRFDDYRPQVHDSDGLMAQTGGGEWLWRPLVNPKELRVNRYMDEHPKGFGLIQRDRDFMHYQDAESNFQRRPSYWIQPLGDWAKGGVELVEIPTDEEIHDNIVGYWVPSAPVEASKPLKFAYLLSSHSDSATWPPGGKAIATRTTGAGTREDVRRVIIDFAGGDLDGLDRTQPVRPYVSATGGRVDMVTVERLGETGAWRVTFRVTPSKSKQAVDIRCYLTLYGEALTETWMDQLTT